MATFYVVVVSDTVYSDRSRDVSGIRAVEILRSKGHNVLGPSYIPNNYGEVVRKVVEMPSGVDVAIFIGGTGPSPRDITVDAIESVAWRKIPGFGELFRRLSYEAVGSKAILSRAELYLLPIGKAVAVLPGSPKAVEIGLHILLDIVDHLIEEMKRFEGPHKPP